MGEAARRHTRRVGTQDDLTSTDRRLLQMIYDLMNQRGSWPTFTAVDLRMDRDLGIEDTQASLLAIPVRYLRRPWQVHGFNDNDEVRLTLRGVASCQGGDQDVATLARFVSWLTELERTGNTDESAPPVATSSDFARHLGLTIVPAPPEHEDAEPVQGYFPDSEEDSVPETVSAARQLLARVKLLAELIPHFFTQAVSNQDSPWIWEYQLDRRRVRPYRRVNGPEQLIEFTEADERSRRLASTALISGGLDLSTYGRPAEDTSFGFRGESTELDILMTMLRAEISEATIDLIRSDLFDEAIFAAFRRVEDELQRRTASNAIGDTLIQHAFKNSNQPVRISMRERDTDRMAALLGGAIGLLKGDRSHKDRPTLPCRSRRECIRLLAHASSLLDLLDRDVDRAPDLRGYEHSGTTLTLWVDRASADTNAWLDDDTVLTKIAYRPGSLTLDVSGVSPGGHQIHLSDGTRQGPAREVWLTSVPETSNWYRVIEVNIPLYRDAEGNYPLDAAVGLRLAVREAGVESERIVPTRESYEVGHYVQFHYAESLPAVPEAWVRQGEFDTYRVWNSSALFDGQPVAPAHSERLMRISIQPSRILARHCDRSPLRVLGHYTDGTATWSKPMTVPDVTVEDSNVAFYKSGTIFAKAHGTTVLRARHESLYAEAVIDVAAHPRYTVSAVMTALPSVSGVAWTPRGLIVSTREQNLWLIDLEGRFQLAARVPLTRGALGTDTVSARAEDGELAVRLVGDPRVLVLHASDEYNSSHWVNPPRPGETVMACAWDAGQLLLGTSGGSVLRVASSGKYENVSTFDGSVLSLQVGDQDELFVVTYSPE